MFARALTRSIRLVQLLPPAASMRIARFVSATVRINRPNAIRSACVTQQARGFSQLNPNDKDFDAVVLLREEHMKILHCLEFLDVIGMRVKQKDKLTDAEMKDMLTMMGIIRDFADAHHHHKEELFLFKKMLQYGHSTTDGPLGAMYHDHTSGREFVADILRILQTLQKAKEWDADSKEELAVTIGAYTTLLRRHILREEANVFPMCVNSLPKEDLEWVNEKSREYEKPLIPKVEKWLSTVEALRKKYNISE